jgi:peptide deformylase
MYAAPGIGLAAIQIGVAKRIIVMDISRDGKKNEPMFFVNPATILVVTTNSVYLKN